MTSAEKLLPIKLDLELLGRNWMNYGPSMRATKGTVEADEWGVRVYGSGLQDGQVAWPDFGKCVLDAFQAACIYDRFGKKQARLIWPSCHASQIDYSGTYWYVVYELDRLRRILEAHRPATGLQSPLASLDAPALPKELSWGIPVLSSLSGLPVVKSGKKPELVELMDFYAAHPPTADPPELEPGKRYRCYRNVWLEMLFNQTYQALGPDFDLGRAYPIALARTLVRGLSDTVHLDGDEIVVTRMSVPRRYPRRPLELVHLAPHWSQLGGAACRYADDCVLDHRYLLAEDSAWHTSHPSQ